jgi:hypothetical protein
MTEEEAIEPSLAEVIEYRRTMLPVEDEVRAWEMDKGWAEELYLATIRLCDERIMSARKRKQLPLPLPPSPSNEASSPREKPE